MILIGTTTLRLDLPSTCLLAGLNRASQKAIHFEKLQEIIQDRTENPSTFLDRLTRALQQNTNIDPESTDGRQLLMTYCFSQSYPNIRAKLKKLDRDPPYSSDRGTDNYLQSVPL
jgi:hypothetical protein